MKDKTHLEHQCLSVEKKEKLAEWKCN